MLKSGLIVGAITILLAIGATVLSPICTPCLSVFLGLAAGYLAGVFDKPLDNGSAVKKGAGSGAIGGIGAILGLVVGQVINAVVVGPQGAATLLEQYGIQSPEVVTGYWGGLIGATVCFGLLSVALMAGLGALGGLLWWQITGKNAAPSAEVMQ